MPDAYASSNPAFQNTMQAYSSAINANFLDADGRGTSGRHDLTYEDYSDVRPLARIPRKHDDIMREMDRVYDDVGLIKNIIDLMSDFVMQGICISHPIPKWQRFYRNWFNRIGGISTSERIGNNLFKYGTAIVSRKWGKLSIRMQESLETSRATEVTDSDDYVKRSRIPVRYTFKNPCFVDVIGGRIASFMTTERRYGIKLTPLLANAILHPSSASEREIVATLPKEVKEAAKNEYNTFPLDPHDTIVLHYKKNDWETWSKPMIYAVLREVHLLQKLQVADFTALDGAVDHVRVFKLGNLEHKLVPTEAGVSKLNELLHASIGAGVRNIIWGPDIELIESGVDIHQFLGDDKYQPALNGIYAGLGIPPTLTGTGSQSSGTTNNLVSLKALIRRLDYVRQELIRFWTKELGILHKNLGHRDPAEIEFDIANFGDEEAEKKLWIDLADRNIVSHEWVQRRFGAVPDLEQTRLRREEKARQTERDAQKAGPWHDPHQLEMDRMKKEQLQIQKEKEKDQEQQQLQKQKLAQPSGRPDNARDNTPRKRRRFVPQVRAARLHLRKAMTEVEELVNPFILHKYGKSSLRALSSEQTYVAEKIKVSAFFAWDYGEKIAGSLFHKISDGGGVYTEYINAVQELESELNRKLSVQERQDIAIDVYLEKFGNG